MSTQEAPFASTLDEQLRAALRERQAQTLHRALRTLPAGTLDLASNDYLGLSRHPAVVEAAQAAIAQWGSGARASRLVSGHTPLHQELEDELAAFTGCEAALLFSSGYAANLSVVTALARPGDVVLCDKRNHASLIDACRLAETNGTSVRYYGSLEKLQSLLLASSTRDVRRLIVSDAVYSMDGDMVNLPRLLQLAHELDATIILDDAHGMGTLGRTGRGAMEHFDVVNAERVIHIGTLSKALGSQGGFAAGSRTLIDWLINMARPFIYSTGLAPSACGAALAALCVLRAEPQRVARLKDTAQTLACGLSRVGLQVQDYGTPILAAIMGEAEDALHWSVSLQERGVWCPAIRPPTVPVGTSRLRVTASADLSEADVERALKVFAQVRNEYSSKAKE
jgi:8-amino-7-oxononanoate synthase